MLWSWIFGACVTCCEGHRVISKRKAKTTDRIRCRGLIRHQESFRDHHTDCINFRGLRWCLFEAFRSFDKRIDARSRAMRPFSAALCAVLWSHRLHFSDSSLSLPKRTAGGSPGTLGVLSSFSVTVFLSFAKRLDDFSDFGATSRWNFGYATIPQTAPAPMVDQDQLRSGERKPGERQSRSCIRGSGDRNGSGETAAMNFLGKPAQGLRA